MGQHEGLSQIRAPRQIDTLNLAFDPDASFIICIT
jgi:hypothetical protein